MDFYVDLQPDVQHHGGDDIQIGELDPQPPGQVEEDEQGAGQAFGEDPIGAYSGRLGEPDYQLGQGRHTPRQARRRALLTLENSAYSRRPSCH